MCTVQIWFSVQITFSGTHVRFKLWSCNMHLGSAQTHSNIVNMKCLHLYLLWWNCDDDVLCMLGAMTVCSVGSVQWRHALCARCDYDVLCALGAMTVCSVCSVQLRCALCARCDDSVLCVCSVRWWCALCSAKTLTSPAAATQIPWGSTYWPAEKISTCSLQHQSLSLSM